MYSAVLTTHSWLRWVIVLLAFVAVLRAIMGWQSRRMWTRVDDRTGLMLMIAVDLQLLLGLLLYFVYSPLTALAMDDFGNAMQTPGLRYWAVEHVFSAVIGIALIHVGRMRAKKTSDSKRKHRTTAIFFSLALLALLVAIPWPGTPNARPLFPR
jgi:cell division protein FtsW (lipid II flippase)